MRALYIAAGLTLALGACLKPPPESPDASLARPYDAGEPPLKAYGAPCATGVECLSGHCKVTCDSTPYCANACDTHSDCALDGEATYCCGAGGYCEQVPGSSCGDGSGGSGAECYRGGTSACAAGLICVDRCQVGAVCSASCQTDADCQAVNPTHACLTTAGGDKRCIADPDLHNACSTDADCDPDNGVTCQLTISWRGTHTIVACAPRSPYVETNGLTGEPINGALGDSCLWPASEGGDDQPYFDECSANFCWTEPDGDNTCGAFCETDADCTCPHIPEGECLYRCVDVSLQLLQDGPPSDLRVCQRDESAVADAGVEDAS